MGMHFELLLSVLLNENPRPAVDSLGRQASLRLELCLPRAQWQRDGWTSTSSFITMREHDARARCSRCLLASLFCIQRQDTWPKRRVAAPRVNDFVRKRDTPTPPSPSTRTLSHSCGLLYVVVALCSIILPLPAATIPRIAAFASLASCVNLASAHTPLTRPSPP